MTSTPLRIVAWNLNHWQQPLQPGDVQRRAWRWLRTLGADLGLLQEAVPPADDAPAAVYSEIGGYRNWGSAVVTHRADVTLTPIRTARMRWGRRRYRLDASYPGAVAIARAEIPHIQPITFVSVYGVHDGSPVMAMHRIIADLQPLFDSPDGARVILGGDFNVGGSTSDAVSRARAAAVLAGVEALGLVNAKTCASVAPGAEDCYCGQGPACGHLPTFGRAELDHLFLSAGLAGNVTSLALDRTGLDAGDSDHAALVLDLALSADPIPQPWDEDSFVAEMGRRCGAQAAAVVETLVNWAERTERDLTKAAGVSSKVLTRFPTNGITTQPELYFPVDVQTEPRASQSTISISAKGMVVVWFGSMRVPPFDTSAGRRELLPLFNAIPGVEIREDELSSWPRFSIDLLYDGTALSRLIDALDRIATGTSTSLGAAAFERGDAWDLDAAPLRDETSRTGAALQDQVDRPIAKPKQAEHPSP